MILDSLGGVKGHLTVKLCLVLLQRLLHFEHLSPHFKESGGRGNPMLRSEQHFALSVHFFAGTTDQLPKKQLG